MKTFEQVVDSTFKPKPYKLLFREDSCVVFHLKKGKIKWISDRDKKRWVDSKDKLLLTKYETSKAFSKPFYGRDIQQPVINICKKMLEKPESFEENLKSFLIGTPSRFEYTIVVDKGTGFSLEFKEARDAVFSSGYREDKAYSTRSTKTEVFTPDCFSSDERKLLVETFLVWKKHMDERNKVNFENSYKKHREQERQKLMAMYVDQSYD